MEPMLQVWVAIEFPEHELPPFSSWVVITLPRTCTDPPHVAPHVDHDVHEPQTQFTNKHSQKRDGNHEIKRFASRFVSVRIKR